MKKSMVLALACCAALAGCSQVSDTLQQGDVVTGLVARTLCTAVFVQGRTEQEVRDIELGPLVYAGLNDAVATVNRERGEVETRFFGVFRGQAGHTPGLGCAVDRPGEGAGAPIRPAYDPRPFPLGDAPTAAADGVDLARLKAAVDAAFAPNPGPLEPNTRSIVLVRDGKLLLERHAPGWDGRTPQYSASMSKTATAALVGVLVGRGTIDLDAAQLDPAWTDERSKIRVRDLLHMESGLGFDESYTSGVSDPARMIYSEHSAAAFAAAKPAREQPGERFYYSSGDTNLLMRAAKEAFFRAGGDQAAWDAFPRQALFDPIGMRGAIFEQDAAGDFLGSTFLFASALDWARFGLLLAQDGVWEGERVLPEGWVDFMGTATAASEGSYGAQTWLRGGTVGAGRAPVLELSGYAGQMVAIHPETRTVIVRLGWNPNTKAFDREAFLRSMFDALAIEAPSERNGRDGG